MKMCDQWQSHVPTTLTQKTRVWNQSQIRLISGPKFNQSQIDLVHDHQTHVVWASAHQPAPKGRLCESATERHGPSVPLDKRQAEHDKSLGSDNQSQVIVLEICDSQLLVLLLTLEKLRTPNIWHLLLSKLTQDKLLKQLIHSNNEWFNSIPALSTVWHDVDISLNIKHAAST